MTELELVALENVDGDWVVVGDFEGEEEECFFLYHHYLELLVQLDHQHLFRHHHELHQDHRQNHQDHHVLHRHLYLRE